MGSAKLLLALVMVTGLLQLQSARAASYTVGGATGWTLGIGATFYDDWAKAQTFVVGDVLVFDYAGVTHNVFEVSQADETSCSLLAPLKTYLTSGGASITLAKAGYHGYICGVPGHCLLNMKMNVNVTAAAIAPVVAPVVAPAVAPVVSPTKAPAKPPTKAPAPSPKKALSPTPTPAVAPASAPAPEALAPSAPAPEALAPGPSTMGTGAASGLRSGPIMIFGAVLGVFTALMFQ